MRKEVYYLIGCMLLLSCSGNNRVVERISDVPFTVLNEEILTSIPGALMCSNDFVVWQDPREMEGFLHILDAESGQELARWGNIGEGPEEFTAVSISFSYPPFLDVIDLNNGNMAKLHISETGEVEANWSKLGLNEESLSVLTLDDSHILHVSPLGEKPFRLVDNNNNVSSYGTFPAEGGVSNAFEVYQAAVTYGAREHTLLYSMMSFPYWAMYDYKDGELNLLWEQGDAQNWRKVGNELQIETSERGKSTLCLTKKHIVVAQRDVETEGEPPTDARGRDMRLLPHSLFVYDKKGILSTIINLGLPIIRIAGNDDASLVYAIVADPDFKLIKIDLANIG